MYTQIELWKKTYWLAQKEMWGFSDNFSADMEKCNMYWFSAHNYFGFSCNSLDGILIFPLQESADCSFSSDKKCLRDAALVKNSEKKELAGTLWHRSWGDGGHDDGSQFLIKPFQEWWIIKNGTQRQKANLYKVVIFLIYDALFESKFKIWLCNRYLGFPLSVWLPIKYM